MRTRHWLLAALAGSLWLASTLHAQSPQADPARPIPYKEDGGMVMPLVRAGLGLAIIAVVVFGGIHVYKRLGKWPLGVASKRLRVVETVRLSPRSALFLVEMDQKSLLLGMHGQELRVLCGPDAGALSSAQIGEASRADTPS